jgi:hypothetical protein
VDVQCATTKTVQEMLSPMQAKGQHSETNPIGGSSNPSSPSSLEGSPNPEHMQRSQSLEENLDDNITSKPEIYQANDFEDTVEESKKEIPKKSTVARAQSDSEPITFGRVEVLTRLEHFLKSDEVNSKEADLFKRLENALQKREAQSGRGPTKSKSKPIKFKDAVGRKFSFPFDLCKTWAVGLTTDFLLDFSHERLIPALCREWKILSIRLFCMLKLSDRMSQKVDTIFVGPNGEIILPQI